MAFWGHHKCKTPKLVIFYDVQISRIKKKNTLCERSQAFYKVCVQGEGSKMMVVRKHMDYLLPIENENVLLS